MSTSTPLWATYPPTYHRRWIGRHPTLATQGLTPSKSCDVEHLFRVDPMRDV